MGFIHDLFRRWFGATPKPARPAPPRPTPPRSSAPEPAPEPDLDPIPRRPAPPIATAGLPWLAPAPDSIEAEPIEAEPPIAAGPVEAEPTAGPIEAAITAGPVEAEPLIAAAPFEPIEPAPAPSAVELVPIEPGPAIEPAEAAPIESAPAIERAEAAPVTPPEVGAEVTPEVATFEPEPGPETETETETETVEVIAPAGRAVPRPLGLPGDLDSPLWGDWGSIPVDPAEHAGAEVPALADDPAARAGRRAARRAEVAARHATDIRYLGRGVSATLGDRRGDRAGLERAGLPVLDSPAELAERLGISIPRLRWLAFHAEVATRVHYVGFEVAKKGGGTRRLSAPHRSLALAQRWILAEIVARLPTGDPAHGFVAGRSIVTNARAHAGRAVVVNLDLEGFFPAIGFPRVRAVFGRAGYSPAIATILGLLCTEAPRRAVAFEGTTLHVATGPRGLPQGACTSPGLSNQVARRLDRRLAGLAARLGAAYTRYADDLTFSGGPDLDPRVGFLLAQARRIAASEGFAVNEAKTRVLRPNAAQVVTGLVVNDRPGVPRDEVRRLRAILHRARAEGLDAQNRAGHPDFRAYLLGKIAFVGMARPDVAARLLEAYRAVEPG